MNIHNAPADMTFYAGLTDDELKELAIVYRNEILDELRRREETIEAKAETQRGYHIPTWPYAR
jgi:hypothetical protein